MTTTTSTTEDRQGGRVPWAFWLPGLFVAVGAGVVTAHGLYEVALASSVPAAIAWLYPVITDGLALVAYVSTVQLTDGGRAYAWAVVVLSAGLSGVAQASYLAGGVGAAPPALRFVVGAWPAIAAAIAAHLLSYSSPTATTAFNHRSPARPTPSKRSEWTPPYNRASNRPPNTAARCPRPLRTTSPFNETVTGARRRRPVIAACLRRGTEPAPPPVATPASTAACRPSRN